MLGATTAVTVGCVGVALEQIRFPLSYQAVFLASFGGALLSFAFSRQITLPDHAPPDTAPGTRQAWGAQLRGVVDTLGHHAAYTRFLVSQFVFNVGVVLAIPLFPLYWVRELHASDAWVGTIALANQGVVLIAYFVWAAVVRRTSAVVVLRVCSFGLVLYPVLTVLTHSVPPPVVYAALAGIFGAGLNLVLFDLVLCTCPPEQTASYVRLYQWTIFLATLVAPLVGTTIAERWGYTPALFLAGCDVLGHCCLPCCGLGAVVRHHARDPLSLPMGASRKSLSGSREDVQRPACAVVCTLAWPRSFCTVTQATSLSSTLPVMVGSTVCVRTHTSASRGRWHALCRRGSTSGWYPTASIQAKPTVRSAQP